MGDHFGLLVDQLLTESNLEATIERKNRICHPMASTNANADNMISSSNIDVESVSPSSIVQCRICHDEDDGSKMETPCSCCGSLKYAHRKCIQRWCNEKGDTICEICHQDFKPGYTSPPPVFYYGDINSPIHFRGSWEMSRLNLHVPAGMPDHEYLDSDFDDFFAPSPRSILCCRVVAVIFIALLVLRHTLPIVISGAGGYSWTLLMLLILRIVGILLPIYVMVKAFTYIQRRHRYQAPRLQLTTLGDNSESTNHSQSHLIHLR
ncbi:E3 ubiquitin-protein ligase MARCH2 isoform X2 [Cucumis sativus]|uniref:RING-CH-type domain-containing protein n=2 Tax=Cucumis sativus TaxID=3659 RepID=A0A0A0LBM8_CUCSA|nr:E3 ubiquitin-protein ligase MARCH2 isoform X2 [Cucumis sativus]XP_011651203.1 E3 ubiquitin-protein ligase MARCH2 isoform X2 [Cucumis sativus]XP_031738306.1 E3 ubiquitin-protein ligase MARCH2 isoform X2 [Cucumis sativus]KGN57446.1 hypothetical protein Csa_011549 [Cucumis sativus]